MALSEACDTSHKSLVSAVGLSPLSDVLGVDFFTEDFGFTELESDIDAWNRDEDKMKL